MAAAAVIIFILSRFIWNIEIDGNLSHTDTSIILFLREKGICTGRLKKNIDLDSLEEDLRLAYDDISWVSARIEGTVLKIQLRRDLFLHRRKTMKIFPEILWPSRVERSAPSSLEQAPPRFRSAMRFRPAIYLF